MTGYLFKIAGIAPTPPAPNHTTSAVSVSNGMMPENGFRLYPFSLLPLASQLYLYSGIIFSYLPPHPLENL